MADNFDMKKFLTENQIGPYAKAKVKEDMEIKRMQQLAGLLNEGRADNLLAKVIAIVKDEYNKGNKNDIVSLMNIVNKNTGYRVDNSNANSGPVSGMKGFTVGNFIVLVSLVDKTKYKSVLSKEESKDSYTKIGDWWIRLWDYDAINIEKVKEDMGHDIEDAEAEKQMDFLAEKPVEESVDMKSIQKAEMALQNLLRNISTNSNIPTADKEGLLGALGELQDFVDEVGFDAEVEQDNEAPVSDYSRRRQSDLSEESVRMFKSDNPEGDQLVLRFLKGIATKFDYPVQQAALFVKERIKKLGY